jgi:hypothetical protein
MPLSVSLKGMGNPVRRSRSRLPPVMLSTVSIIMLTPAVWARSIMPVQAAILIEVELIDLRRVVPLAQLFDAGRTKGRHPEHGAEFGSCGSDGPFPIMTEQPAAGLWEQYNGIASLAHHGDRHVDSLYATQHVGHQVTRSKLAEFQRCVFSSSAAHRCG